MDLTTLKTYEPPPHRYTPEYAGNREEEDPFVVLHRPLIRAYQLEVLDIQARLEEQRPADNAGPKALRAYAMEADRALAEYHRRVLQAHLIGVEGLTSEGRSIELDEFVAACLEMPDLVTELIAAVRDAGSVTEGEAGN